jgi:hypothetical protein
MLRRRLNEPRKPKRLHLPGDNPLLRRAFERELGLPLYELERRYNVVQFQVNLNHAYHEWLRAHGIDPDTGKMTDAGVAFFKMLIDEQNAVNRAKRKTGRRAA